MECCIASKQTISGEKGWEHKVFLFFFFEHDPHTIYKCFLNRSASLNSFSLFFLPSHHMCPFMTDSVGTRDTMKLQDFDAVENTGNFTSTTAVSC